MRELAQLCGELGPGDGDDPRYDRTSSRKHRTERKAWQLCKQVATTLQLSLDGSDDPRLRSIQVLAVQPAPDASHLCIRVAPKPDATHSMEVLNDRLEAARSDLRFVVAQAITRRRAPELTVSWVPLIVSLPDESVADDEEAP